MKSVVFLRGLNLGRRRITNEELKRHFEELGFGAAETFLASGNVVFEARSREDDEISRRIGRGLAEALGYEVLPFVRSAAEVRAVAAAQPFDPAVVERAVGKLQVAFLSRPAAAAEREAVLALDAGGDLLAFGERELYWLANGGVARPDLDWKSVERILGPTTVRTRRTIERLVARFL